MFFFLKPVIGVEIVSTVEIYYRYFIACIQAYNNKNTGSKCQVDLTEVLEQCELHTTGIKQTQKGVQKLKEWR